MLVLNADDLQLRAHVYRLFVELGRAPIAEEVAVETGEPLAAVEAGWERLHDAHAVVVDRDTGTIRMANPFSAVPTPHRVFADDRWWYANCAWDALGICAALHVDGVIETSCADCGDEMTLHVVDGRPDDETVLFHCLVPATAWWDDIVHT